MRNAAGRVAKHVGANELEIFNQGFYKTGSLRDLHQRGPSPR
jgi:hypothetical protein